MYGFTSGLFILEVGNRNFCEATVRTNDIDDIANYNPTR